MPNEKKELTKEQIDALKCIHKGADISGYGLARTLREIHNERPELLSICQPMGNYHVREKLPYFGAILTKEGCLAVGLPVRKYHEPAKHSATGSKP